MDIDLLTSSMIYKDIFKNIPKIYESYENYLKIIENQKIKQKPFKTLIAKYKEEKNSLLFKDEIPYLLMQEITNKFYDYYPEWYNTELAFFSGITKWRNFDCFTYYDIENEMILYVEPSSNNEFLKSFFVETNENILDNISIKNKDWKINLELQEWFVINKNKYEKLQSLQK